MTDSITKEGEKKEKRVIVPLPASIKLSELQDHHKAFLETLFRQMLGMGEVDIILVDEEHELVKDGTIKIAEEDIAVACSVCEEEVIIEKGEWITGDASDDAVCSKCIDTKNEEVH